MDYIKERLGAYLGRTGETKREVAAALEISESALYDKLRGTTEFSFSEAKRLAILLGCTLDELNTPMH